MSTTRLGIKFWEKYYVQTGYNLEVRDFSDYEGIIGVSFIGQIKQDIFVELEFTKSGIAENITVEKGIGSVVDILEDIDNPTDKQIKEVLDKYSN